MKFKNLETQKIIETNDKDRINKLKGYPDKFQIIEEDKKEVKKEDKKEEIKEEVKEDKKSK